LRSRLNQYCSRAAIAVLLAWFSVHSNAYAAAFGSVRGTLEDSRDRPVEGAEVVLKSATSSYRQVRRTNASGKFSFATVAVGDYALSVKQAGFAPVTQAVTLTSGSFPNIRIKLAESATLETVTVSANAVAVINSVTPTTLVNSQDIERTPGADRTNSLAMITDYVPGAYVVHDQLHVRGGHQTTWAIDGVEIPNTNIASNLGPQIDPKDIDTLEIERGSYGADIGDRTYGVFNTVPKTGFGSDNQADLMVSGGSFGQTNDYLSVASHTDDLAYYVSANGNRSGLGIQTPVAQIIHDSEQGYGAFGTFVYNIDPQDQLRLVASVRADDYDIPESPGDMTNDTQREADSFAILSWVRTLSADAVLTTSLLYHYNRANLDGDPNDYPISTSDRRASSYAGGQENLRMHLYRNDIRVGLLGFSQQDHNSFNVLFNDGSNPSVNQGIHPSGSLVAGYIQDTFTATSWLTLMGGVRQTHFDGNIVENATSPRVGATVRVPGLDWVFRAFYGQYYQAPPLETLSGPLLQYAQNSNLDFLPLHGERDSERQFGVTIPVGGWTIDGDYTRTVATNFFDHNNIGNSNVFLPLTIDGALIRAWELTVRSPRFWTYGQVHVAYSNQTADGIGAINGGLTDFSPSAGYFALDHDQRNTFNGGFDANLPWSAYASINVYYGSGFANGDAPPSHLPGHPSIDMSVGKSFGKSCSASITALNIANRHLLIDNSLTFGGFHYDDPRQIVAAIHYRFGY
jgi:carboxypeptidase family protein/TonB-dependent receptor-like protein